VKAVLVVAAVFALVTMRPPAPWALAQAAEQASARPATTAGRAEAAERFDRGMALLEEGDNAGALAELTRVYALAPHPQVLFNLGLIHAAMGRPVEATRTLDEVLAAPGALPADSLRIARRTRDDQARRVALLEVTTNVPATIEADGIEMGKTPFAQPIPVAAGARVISAVSPGYLPVRREINVAGQATEKLQLDLAPSELRMAHLGVRSALPDADVFVDGQRVGRTPLPSSLALPPGQRTIELRRAGYRPAQRKISLADGATGELTFDLSEDQADRANRGRLVLVVSEADPDVTIDGQVRGAYQGPLSLPPGLHDVRIARAGFLPTERTVTVSEGAEAVAKVTLVPTPETRAAYKRRAEVQRRWGWIGSIGGAALGVGAGVLVALNRGPLANAQANIDGIRATPVCHPSTGMVDDCAALLTPADDEYNKRKTVQNVGLVAVGVGVIAASIGTVLVLIADDPYHYDRAPRDLDAPKGLALSSWLGPAGGGLSVAGRF
jgi:PEGA domain